MPVFVVRLELLKWLLSASEPQLPTGPVTPFSLSAPASVSSFAPSFKLPSTLQLAHPDAQMARADP